MISFLLAAAKIYLVLLVLFEALMYDFRWYEISNRAYDRETTWIKALSWKRWLPVRTFIKECAYVTVYLFTWIIGKALGFSRSSVKEYNRSKFKKDSPVVILIHGYMANTALFWLMKLRFSIKKTPNVVTFGYKEDGVEIERYRAALRDFVLRLQSETGVKDVIFIGHSFGGIIAFDYAAEYGETGEIKGVCALGSPFRGTRLAALALTSLARSLHPTNPLFREIIDTRINAPFISIYSSYDQVILPYTNSEHPKADSNVELDGCGHSGFYFNREVFKVVSEWLNMLN